MKKKSHVGIAFLTIIALALCGGVGYYLVDNTVNLNKADSVTNGKWCVKLEGLSKPKLEGQAFSDNYSAKKTVLSFHMKLTDPNDKISYKLKVKNCGTVDAYLYSLDLSGYDNKEALTYVVNGIEEGDTLKAGEVVPVSVDVSSKDEEVKESDLKLNFNFSQER